MQKNYLNYPVEIVSDAFVESETLAALLKQASGHETPRVLLLADCNVVQHTPTLGTRIGAFVQRHGIRLAGAPILLPGGERAKGENLRCVIKVWGALQEAEIGVHDLVLILGGGALLDVGGFAASLLWGGVPVVRMPTSPAAMFGAAFAETVAMDSSKAKDILRVRNVPAAVVLDPDLAVTTLGGVWQSGFAEAVRLALARDAAFFKKVMAAAGDYRERKVESLKALLEGAVALRRKKGDTDFAVALANRLEEMSGFKLPHGYAIVLAVALETAYAVECGVLPEATRDGVISAFEASGALDCMQHSRYLLANPEPMLEGIGERSRSGAAFEVLAGVGKTAPATAREADAFARAASFLFSRPARG